MPYSKSQARKAFDTEIDNMISVIRSTFSNATTSGDTRQYVLNCSVFLASAKMEVYFEDFIKSWVHKINGAHLTSAHLPNNLKALFLNQTFLNNAFKKLIVENSESHYIEAVSSQLANDYFHLTDVAKRLPTLDANKIYEKKKYPSPKNVKALFKRMGINNIFGELNRSAGANLEAVLESFNDIRTAVAHNGIPVGLNDTDVILKLQEIKQFINHMDRTLFRHVSANTTLATWTV